MNPDLSLGAPLIPGTEIYLAITKLFARSLDTALDPRLQGLTLHGVYQALFIISTTGVILVDAPPTIGQKILFAIGNSTHLPFTHVIYSHSHADHIGGASVITAAYPNATIIAHTDTFTHLKITGDPTRPLPAKTFQNEYELYDFTHYVGGHLSRPGTRDDVQTQKKYVTDLFANCKAAIEASATDDAVLGPQKIVEASLAANPGISWAEFRTYLDVIDDYCADVTGEVWDGVLAGVDVFGESNANVMVESLRIDYGVLGPLGAM
ncbi:hypothetical protein BDR22DRAFT_824460 [Usnea florida]